MDSGLSGAHCFVRVAEKFFEDVHLPIKQPQVNMRSRHCLEMDIGVVRETTGLTSAALHHYEQLGLITPTGRVGLRRQYDDEILEILAVIALCQRSGFTLEEIHELMARRRSTAWKTLAQTKIQQMLSAQCN